MSKEYITGSCEITLRCIMVGGIITPYTWDRGTQGDTES